MTTTPGGLLLVLAVLVPFVGVLAGLAFGGRNPQRIALLTIVIGGGIALALGDAWLRTGSLVVYLLGGWAPPLGVALRADATAVAMMLVISVVIAGIGVYACADFGTPADQHEARAPFTFWLLLMAVWGSLNLVFVSGDLFTLYVALELLTFAGVPLVCLDGRGETLRAALRYLLFALLGSVLYLLGAVLLFGAYGTLDISLLAARIRPEPATWAAAALMTTGLLAKTALFPLHLWLPPAHAGAPAAASAVLSALVVKGSWFLVVRLWFDVMPGVVTLPSAEMLGALGAMAILLFSVVALRQERLKLLIAYSTLAQIGYLFLMFPLAFDAAAGRIDSGGALTAGMLQAMAHATAKAAMFMAAGSIYAALGHDRIAGLAGIARALPVSVLAFGIGGVALMGVLPSGAYLAKKLLLGAAAGSGQWWWDAVLQAGGVLTTSYVVLVLACALRRADEPIMLKKSVSRVAQSAALALAVCSFLLACAALGPLPASLVSNPLKLSELVPMLLTVMAGGALAFAFGSRPPRVPRAGGVGGAFEHADAVLRRWPVAGISLLVVAAMFGCMLVAAR
ncbi:MAG TPA: proton-conducting transporter membrane subunit [Casimicrobiaceae bacterium]|nr:proton-conducting transporter membrane subunit [Casimicrobiaceae bacterium]